MAVASVLFRGFALHILVIVVTCKISVKLLVRRKQREVLERNQYQEESHGIIFRGFSIALSHLELSGVFLHLCEQAH